MLSASLRGSSPSHFGQSASSRMTGIRSWSVAISSFGSVVMISAAPHNLPLTGSRHSSHRPAIVIRPSSAMPMANGCLSATPSLRHSLEPVRHDEAALSPLPGIPKDRLLGDRLGSRVERREGHLRVLRPTRIRPKRIFSGTPPSADRIARQERPRRRDVPGRWDVQRRRVGSNFSLIRISLHSLARRTRPHMLALLPYLFLQRSRVRRTRGPLDELSLRDRHWRRSMPVSSLADRHRMPRSPHLSPPPDRLRPRVS